MRRQRLQALSCPDVPDAHRLVEAAGHDEIALRVEVAAEDVIAVALERLEALAAAELPDLQGFVVAGGDQESAVAAPRDVADAQLVSGDGLLELAVVGAPNLDELVGGWKWSNVRLRRATEHPVGGNLQELASHSPFGLNLTADTAFMWPARVNFSV